MQKVLNYIGVGITATIIDYLVYSLVVMVIFGGNTSFAGVGAVCSGIVAACAAFVMHSKITWKDRDPGKYGILKFFAWNAFVVIVARPILTSIFGLIGGLYEFAFSIFGGIGIGFSYEFVESTGIYLLMTGVTMTLNFIFYDKIVFGKSENGIETATEKEGQNRTARTKSEETRMKNKLTKTRKLDKEQREEVNMKSVRKSGKEKKSNSKDNKNSNK